MIPKPPRIVSGGHPSANAMPRAYLSWEQADDVRARLARDELEAALDSLQQAASAQHDKGLRTVAINKQGDLAGIKKQHDDGLIDPKEVRRERTRIRDALSHIVEEHEVTESPPRSPPVTAAPLSGSAVTPPPKQDEPRDVPILRCTDLTKSYRGGFTLPVIKAIELKTGEIMGVVGFNGAGKTTLLRMIAKDLDPSSGTVWIGDRNDRGQKLENLVTFVPQAPAPWNGTLRAHLRRQAAFFGCTEPDANGRLVEDTVKLLRLGAVLDRACNELSAGFGMRAAIAAALVANSGLVVLDEPLAPLDPQTQQLLLDALAIRAMYVRTAIVVSSQHVPEIESISSRMLTIFEEKIELRAREDPRTEPGLVFKVDLAVRSETLIQRLDMLVAAKVLEAYVPGTSSIVIRFRSHKRFRDVVDDLADPNVIGVHDITRSSLANHYFAPKEDDGEKS